MISTSAAHSTIEGKHSPFLLWPLMEGSVTYSLEGVLNEVVEKAGLTEVLLAATCFLLFTAKYTPKQTQMDTPTSVARKLNATDSPIVSPTFSVYEETAN